MALLWLKSTGGSPPFGADGCFAHLWCRGGRHPRYVHGVEWQDVLAWKTQLPLR